MHKGTFLGLAGCEKTRHTTDRRAREEGKEGSTTGESRGQGNAKVSGAARSSVQPMPSSIVASVPPAFLYTGSGEDDKIYTTN